MGERRHDEAVDVGEDFFDRLAAFRWRLREFRDELARADLREHRESFDVLEVVGDPVNNRSAMASEIVSTHVTERRCEPVRVSHAMELVARRTRGGARSFFLPDLSHGTGSYSV